MFKEIEAVFFDLDGTLVDSVPDLTMAVDRALAELGFSAPGETKVRHWVGNGVEVLLQRALGDAVESSVAPETFAAVKARFDQLYGENICVHSRLYPGVLDGLQLLHREGFQLACITNKPTGFARELVAQLGLGEYFGAVLGGDSIADKKPAPDILLLCARCLGMDIKRVLMVGDSITDVEAARRAGCAVVCVPYGYNHGQDIREARPDVVIESIADLGGLLQRAA